MDISLDAIIGVVATLSGTILGWILGTISNHIGRIKITISNPDIIFFDKNKDILSNGREVKYDNIPERIKISFVMSAYNDYAKMNGINHARCMLKCGRRKYYLKANLESISNFTNMDPYKYYEAAIYHVNNTNVPTEAAVNMKNGYTLYFAYKTNNGFIEHKKKIKKEK